MMRIGREKQFKDRDDCKVVRRLWDRDRLGRIFLPIVSKSVRERPRSQGAAFDAEN